MQVSEVQLDADHGTLYTSILEILAKEKGLTDTDAYRGASRTLVDEMEEGYKQMHEKNIEIWKVHADEATRCARGMNQELEKECGWYCLFNKVPIVHKRTCRDHLKICFSQSMIGSQMSETMQNNVFESWYDKDLFRDVAAVKNKFFMYF